MVELTNGEMMLEYKKSIQLKADNISTINLSKNPISHGKSEHIETKYHFLRYQITKIKLKLNHCVTKFQVPDIFTKPLKIERFKVLRSVLNVVPLEA